MTQHILLLLQQTLENGERPVLPFEEQPMQLRRLFSELLESEQVALCDLKGVAGHARRANSVQRHERRCRECVFSVPTLLAGTPA